MDRTLFSEEDIRQIKSRGMTVEEVSRQIEVFKKGFPFARLRRPCRLDDGIIALGRDDLKRLEKVYSEAAVERQAIKFVPASGAASRMFKLLLAFNDKYDRKTLLRFIRELKHFAFYDDLKSVMSRDGLNLDTLKGEDKFKLVLDYILTPRGLGLSRLPKGLIRFHRYPDHSRTPFEEHLVEAASYTRDRQGIARVHFTVSLGHEFSIKKHIKETRARFEKPETRFEVTYSTQEASTDTIAVDLDNRPFRGKDGRLLFRPGGHGALLKNMIDLKGDIIFIKNIDNVVPDRLKPETVAYKKALAGFLLSLQEKVFGYLDKMNAGKVTEKDFQEIFQFASDQFSLIPPADWGSFPREEKIQYLISKLHRPLRVCGMVRNLGEPGGGPFWVEQSDGTLTPQIIESSQVDMKSSGQRHIWESSTHFNPVDLVCGVRDYRGRPFDLIKFRDPDTGFISVKSREGRDLKALELPGLWNGSMAFWNTVFVEAPGITFNPVKTVFDLVRREHQPG